MSDKNYVRILELRKRLKKERPPAGELVQGIFFAIYTAEEQLKASKLLFENGMENSGFSHLIAAIEEVGKIVQFAEILFDWSTLKKARLYKSKQRNHSWKLKNAFEMLLHLFKQNSKGTKVSGLTKLYEEDNVFRAMIEGLDTKAAERFHDIRLRTSYSNFDGRIVSSPYHHATDIDVDACKFVVDQLLQLSEAFNELSEEVLGIYLKPIKECFLEKNKKRVKSLKKEINRRVGRTIPACRQYFDQLVIEKTGLSMIDSGSIPKEFWADTVLDNEKFSHHMVQIRDLILSHRKLEEKYVFPPLREEVNDEIYVRLKSELFSVGMPPRRKPVKYR